MSTTDDAVLSVLGDVLELDAVPLDAGFFDLGAHSLHALQFVARVEQRFGVRLSLRDIFTTPTVGGIADLVDARLREVGQLVGDRPERSARGRSAPATASHRRLWRQHRADPEDPASHVAVVLELKGELEQDLFRDACLALVERHEALRSAFREDASGALVLEPRPPALDFDWLVRAAGDEQALAHVRRRLETPFDLGDARIFRAGGVALSGGRQLVYLLVHHVAVDDWSVGVALRDLGRLYHGEAMLPVRGTFADFARSQQEALDTGAFSEQIAYWNERLSRFDPMFTLKGGYPPPLERSTPASSYSHALPEASYARIRDVAAAHGVTVYILLLSVFFVFLSRVTGRREVVVGGMTMNRVREEQFEAIGLFANQIFLGETVHPALGFDEFLARVHAMSLEVHENSRVPLDAVLQLRGAAAAGNPWPYARVLFQLVVPARHDDFAGLPARPVPMWSGRTRRDLVFNLVADPDSLSLDTIFSTAVFTEADAAALVGGFFELCEAVCVDPSARIARLSRREGG